MKILIVAPALGDVYGGPSKTVVELSKALGKQGIKIDIVTTDANGMERLNVPLNTWVTEQNYRILYFSSQSFEKYNSWAFSWSLTTWLFQHVNNYDLAHTNGIFVYPVLPAYLACKLWHIPYIVTLHGMLEPWALAYKSQKKALFLSLIEKPALNRASAIHMLAGSEAERARALDIKTPFITIPNGLDTTDFGELPDPEIFYKIFPHTRDKILFIFLGRIDPKKGLDLLAKSFAQVHQQFPDTHLIVAGPDNIGFLPTVQDYFTETGCLESVTFTGMLTGQIKYAALAAASVYVAPSYSEGFSMSVLEGMAAGLPCIITTGCNFPEAGDAQAAYIVNIDAQAIAHAMIRCLKYPQEARETGDRARQLIFQNYTWEKIAKRMIQVYHAIIEQKSLLAFQKYV